MGNTHNLIVGATRIVGPSGLLHDLAGDGLEIHQVVTGSQRWHALDTLLAIGLLGVKGLLLLLDSGHVDLAQMLGSIEELVEGVRGVNWVKLLGRILASILEDDLLAARMF